MSAQIRDVRVRPVSAGFAPGGTLPYPSPAQPMTQTIARFCPAVATWLDVDAWADARLCDGVWRFENDAVPHATRPWLPELADGLLQVDAELPVRIPPPTLRSRCLDALPPCSNVAVLALGRGLRPLADTLRAELGVRCDPGAAHALLLGRRAAWLCRTRFVGGRDPLGRAVDAQLRAGPVIARSEQKWAALRPRLPGLGADPSSVGHWLELGAAPGGITRLLAAAGARVTAVDLAELHPDVSRLAGVSAVVADAHTWTPAAGTRFDGVVCDMNGDPNDAIAAVLRARRWLTADSPTVVTLKLRTWATWPAYRAQLAERVIDAGPSKVSWARTAAHRDRELAMIFL